MVDCKRILPAAILALLLGGMPPVWAGDGDKKADDGTKAVKEKPQRDRAAKFVRVRNDDDGEPVALETAIVRYVPANGPKSRPVVDLIGAIHVADKAYYDRLNKKFRQYDVLLYELVAPEGTVVPRGGPAQTDSFIGGLQGGMSSFLELEHQLECVDYTRPNFVHADMSPKEFAESMKQNDESFTKMFFRIMGQSMAAQSKDPGRTTDAAILAALFSKDRSRRMKLAMAEQFENLDGPMSAFDGENGSTLVSGRNKKALQVLSEQIAAGKKRIGIFYGAGHMKDMQQRLKEEFGLRQGKQEWLVAWDLSEKK